MSFELVDDSAAAVTRYRSSGNVYLDSGQTVKLESLPGGEEFIEWSPPPGKKWIINFGITIHEEDE